jgi:winged helix DNA-binding protein
MRFFTWDEIVARRLARQHLGELAPRTQLAAVVSAVGGVQAQVGVAAGLAIGARVADVTERDVREELWQRRGLVKTYSLRGTLHLHPADEMPLWTAARRALPDWREGRWQAAYGLEPARADAVLAAMADALNGRCLTRAELADAVAQQAGSWARERMASVWADLIGMGFEAGLLCFGPSQGSSVTFARLDQWIGHGEAVEPVEPDAALAAICRRYLAAYGPATHRDFAEWFGGRRLPAEAARALFERLDGEIEEVMVEGKRAWLPKNDAESPAPPTSGLPRLLPQYDCYILGCRFGRERIVPETARKRLFAYKNGRYEGAAARPLLLIDGVVAGMWERRARGKRIEIRVEAFGTLTAEQRERLNAEAARVGEFMEAQVVLTLGALD